MVEAKTNASADPVRRIPWRRSLHTRLMLVQLCLLVLIVGTTVTILWTVEHGLFLERRYAVAEELGRHMVADLEGRLGRAESLATALARVGETLPPDAETFRAVIPEMLNREDGRTLIAGGGIWPVPGAFSPGVERRSFFWGRDAQGKLRYYDDYNNAEGPGYHNQEWYVPATLLDPGECFWSRAYTDPYTHQPMVTCSVPMYRGGKVIGVATVDLKLEDLGAFFTDASRDMGGYIYAVDRNNRVFGHPDGAAPKGGPIHARDLARRHPSIEPLVNELAKVDQRLLARFAGRDRSIVDALARRIDKTSPQIGTDEATLVAAMLTNAGQVARQPKPGSSRVFLDNDPRLDDEALAMIFAMPQTHWKVVVVSPMSPFYVGAHAATLAVGKIVVGLELLALLVMFLAVRWWFIRPVQGMGDEVRRIADAGLIRDAPLTVPGQNELGRLATEFNRRTERLGKAMDRLDRANRDLQEEIGERLRTETELRSSEERFRRYFELGLVGMAVTSPSKGWVQVNDRLCEILGYPMDQLVAKTWAELTHPDDLDADVAEFNRVMAGETDGYSMDKRFIRPDGQVVHASISVRCIRDGEGAVDHFVALVQDISERHAAEVRERQQQTELARVSRVVMAGELASGLAHELHQPLCAISNYGEACRTILAAAGDTEAASELIDEMGKEARRAGQIIHHLRELVQKRDPVREDADLNTLVRRAVGLVRKELEHHGVMLNLDLNPHLPMVEIDKVQIEQVVLNLILNGIESMTHATDAVGGHRLWIATRSAGGRVQLAVRDNGPGVSAENRDRIFDPFFTTKKTGLGMGLHICQSILESHRGRLDLKSTDEPGAEFCLDLPCSTAGSVGATRARSA